MEIYNWDLMNRISFLTVALFYVENMFKSINSGLDKKFMGKGYSNLIKHVLKELHMNDQKKKNYYTLNIPAIVRNLAHGAGLHEDNNDNGKIQGILFKFEKHDDPPYASWRHNCFFIENIIEVLEKVMSNPKVMIMQSQLTIRDEMMDWDAEIQKLKSRILELKPKDIKRFGISKQTLEYTEQN